MSKPQQPEMRRSGHTWVDPDHADEVAREDLPEGRPARRGAVPPENQPGHHPDVEQDKPDRPPPDASAEPEQPGDPDELDDADDPGPDGA